MVVVTTKKCDLRCTHCFRDEYKSEYLDVEVFRKFLADNLPHTSQKIVILTGGEPTLHPQLDEICDVVRKAGIKMNIVSNGQIKKNRDIIIKNKDMMYVAEISIDAPIREINDATRGEGTFDKIVEAVKHYTANGVRTNLLYTLHDGNSHLARESLDLARDIGAKLVMFTAMVPVMKSNADGLSLSSNVADAFALIQKIKHEYPMLEIITNDRQLVRWTDGYWKPDLCSVINGGYHDNFTLLPNGDVSLCCDLYDLDYVPPTFDVPNDPLNPIVGNVKRDDYDKIVKTKIDLMKELRKRRYLDSEAGLIKGDREYMCLNCMFYHYHKAPPKAVPIKIVRK